MTHQPHRRQHIQHLDLDGCKQADRVGRVPAVESQLSATAVAAEQHPPVPGGPPVPAVEPGVSPASPSRATGRALSARTRFPCGQPLVPTGPQRTVQIFSNHIVLAGAPLRNRTIDLLLTLHAGSVGWRRVGSDYRRSEGLACLGALRSVCHCLRPLSLTSSLAPGPSFPRNARSSALANPKARQCSWWHDR